MAVHEWHVEEFSPPGFWNQKDSFTDAGGLPERLKQLEAEGFEIYSLGLRFSSSVVIVYRR